MDQLNPGVRQAALLVHSLNPDDAAWLLAQLAPAAADQVRDLVEELRQIGIAPQPLMPQQWRGAAPVAVKTDLDDPLLHASPAALAALLRSEPAAMTARLLSLKAWPWHADLLDSLGADRRHRVEASLAAEPQCPPALAAALRAAVTQALPMAQPRRQLAVTAPAPPRSWRSRLPGFRRGGERS